MSGISKKNCSFAAASMLFPDFLGLAEGFDVLSGSLLCFSNSRE